jgi:hypothetical protein
MLPMSGPQALVPSPHQRTGHGSHDHHGLSHSTGQPQGHRSVAPSMRPANGSVDPLLERAEFEPGAAEDIDLLAFVLCQRAGVLCVEMVDVVHHQPHGGVRPMPLRVTPGVNQVCQAPDRDVLCAVWKGWCPPRLGGEPVAGLVPVGQTSLPARAWREVLEVVVLMPDADTYVLPDTARTRASAGPARTAASRSEGSHSRHRRNVKRPTRVATATYTGA